LNLKILDEKKAEEDPLINYGGGLLGFRHITGVLILVFFILTLLSMPIIFIYSDGGKVVDKTVGSSLYGIYTLGNMG